MTMKVLQLVAENYKFIKVVDITPDATLQYISGDNEQGKTSLMDSLWAALGGKDASKDTDVPIRKGQTSAKIYVDLGDIRVTRKYTASGTTLEVTTKDGARYPSPQAMLDKLVGDLSFDPLAFTRLPEKEQTAMLQQLLGLDFKALDAQRAEIYQKRTNQNTATKAHENILSTKQIYPDVPEEEIVVADILIELNAAIETIKSSEVAKEGVRQLNIRNDDLISKIEKMQEELAEMIDAQQSLAGRIIAGKQLLNSLVTPDVEEIQQRMRVAEATNRAVRENQTYKEAEANVAESKALSEALTKEIQAIDALKELQLKEAKFPVEGLGFSEDGVTVNDIPFKQCATTARMKVSMAMAMAMNPQLRVIRILDGGLIGTRNMEIIYEMAKENDFQIWIEVVDTSGKMGVTIEDGSVKVFPTEESPATTLT